MKSRLIDFLSIIFSILILIPLIYFTSNNLNSSFSLLFLFIISIPTIIALINGAPFVPTPMPRVETIVKLANLKPKNRVYDIGCGDGRIVYIAANKYKANATGYELSPIVFLLAKIRKIFWKSKAQIKFSNFKNENLSDADVIFCYLLPDCIESIKEKLLQELKPGTKIISYAFEFPYLPIKFIEPRDQTHNFAPILIYEIPPNR